MELVTFDIDLLHFVIGDLAPGWILSAIQAARHFQALRGGCPGDKLDDRFVVAQRLATPIRRDKREQSVLYLVPFAGTGGKMTNRKGKSGLIGQFLQLEFPKS